MGGQDVYLLLERLLSKYDIFFKRLLSKYDFLFDECFKWFLKGYRYVIIGVLLSRKSVAL